MATRWAVLRDDIRRFTLPAIGIANALAVGWLPIRLTDPPFTHSSTSAVAAAATLTAGIALLGSGLLATALRATGALGSLAILVSIAWFAPDWIGWPDAPPLIRGSAMVVAPVLAPIILHLVAAATGALRGATIRTLVFAAYVVTIALSLARALVRDPIRDLDCLEPPRNCSDNAFLLLANENLARQIDLAQVGVAIAISVGLAVMAAWRLLGGTPAARRSHGPLLVSGAVVGVADATYIVLLAAGHLQTAAEPGLGAVFMVRAGGMTAIAIALAWNLVRMRRIGASVARLATEIGAAPAPGGLERALALALGDPDLAVAYRLHSSDSFVDATGMPVAGTPARPGQVATPITRDGQAIAVVLHDAGLVEPEELEGTIGSAARLAVDNERLRAEVLAQVREIAESRTRIVEREDVARLHAERDLHDGAQQRLLAISYELRLGHKAARREGNDDLAATFERLIGGIEAVLEDLRELAHGIFPAVLVEAGLGPALADLANRAALPVEIVGDPGGRCLAASESAAYAVIDEAVRSAADRGATYVRVEIDRLNGRLTARIVDDGAGPNMISDHLADRAGAARGRLTAETDAVRQAVRLEVPCA